MMMAAVTSFIGGLPGAGFLISIAQWGEIWQREYGSLIKVTRAKIQ